MKKLLIITIIWCFLGFAYAQQRPTWITTPPRGDGTQVYFVGISQENETDEATAKAHAMQSAAASVSMYLEVSIASSVEETGFFAGREDDIIDYQVDYKEITTYITQGKVAKLALQKWWAEASQNKSGFKGYGLFSVPLIELQKSADEILAEEISREIAPRRIASQDTLTGKIQVYKSLAADLAKKPVLKTNAYYITGTRKVNLYDYAVAQTRDLPKSIAVEANPPFVQIGDALLVRLTSRDAEKIGDLKCRVSINGNNSVLYTLNSDDVFYVDETKALMQSKNNTIKYELLLGQTSIKTGKISFEVRPLQCAIVVTIDGNGSAEKNNLQRNVGKAVAKILEAEGFSVAVASDATYLVSVSLHTEEEPKPNGMFVSGNIEIVITRNGVPVFPSYSQNYEDRGHRKKEGAYQGFYDVRVKPDLDANFATRLKTAMRGDGK
jgi:hypothetical protein